MEVVELQAISKIIIILILVHQVEVEVVNGLARMEIMEVQEEVLDMVVLLVPLYLH